MDWGNRDEVIDENPDGKEDLEPYWSYRKEISQIPVLGGIKEQEILMEKSGLIYLSSFPVSWEVADYIFSKIEGLRNFFIRSNLRLVAGIAKKYAGRGIPIMDLIQEGNVGLLDAEKRFDSERGIRFASYAVFWIKERIEKFVFEFRMIRIEVRTERILRQAKEVENRLCQIFHRKPSEEELADALEIKVCKIKEFENTACCLRTVSLESFLEIDGGKKMLLIDSIPDFRESPEKEAIIKERNEKIAELISTLKPKEKKVACLRFGFEGEGETLQGIGDVLGLTRERVRQIEAVVLQKMKKKIEGRNII